MTDLMGHVIGKLFAFNAELIEKHSAEITHPESLQPHGIDGNSMNWLLGHIISSRTLVFEHIAGNTVWDDAQRSRYRNGSANVTADEAGVIKFEALLADFRESQRRLDDGFASLSTADLLKPTGFDDETIGGRLAYLQFHETHHVGQLMAASQALGHTGAWLNNWTVGRG